MATSTPAIPNLRTCSGGILQALCLTRSGSRGPCQFARGIPIGGKYKYMRTFSVLASKRPGATPRRVKHKCAGPNSSRKSQPACSPPPIFLSLLIPIHLPSSPLSITMRTSSVKFATASAERTQYFTMGLHLPANPPRSSSSRHETNCSAVPVADVANLHIQMSYGQPSHPTSALSSPSLAQVQSSTTTTMSRSDYCNAHLSRDVPFAAFQLVGSDGRATAAVVGRSSGNTAHASSPSFGSTMSE